ncbi:hypothetical protein CEXT_342381 [Caerostris extrusa]|uniref:Secreted protein n=1 Tax=Caerostris extrusa TaxID=172846 RepID=A0AAV4WBF0_CAEEX|nr:hypothetical protein CEXT_342381 [Caerostris extrusa]
MCTGKHRESSTAFRERFCLVLCSTVLCCRLNRPVSASGWFPTATTGVELLQGGSASLDRIPMQPLTSYMIKPHVSNVMAGRDWPCNWDGTGQPQI